ncbi:glycosyl hydrolase family 28-related protein [Aeribacillus pallidus]|nr:glycosyl hydrolase family 28-related protein [Aeribacillus pallidus]
MARREIGTRWDRENRNNINENFKELYDVQDRAIEEATQSIIDSAKLIWLDPVETYEDIATTYPNPEVGHTVFVRYDGKVYRFYNGSWRKIQEIDPGPVNEVDTRLSAEIEENRQEISQARTKADGTTFPVLRDRLNDVDDKIGILLKRADWVSVKEFGAKGDGVTDDTQAIQDAVNYASTNGIEKVFIPPGTFLITAKIIIPDNVQVIGVGIKSVFQRGYSGVLFDIGKKSSIRKCKIDADGVTYIGDVIEITTGENTPGNQGLQVIEDVEFVNFDSYAIHYPLAGKGFLSKVNRCTFIPSNNTAIAIKWPDEPTNGGNRYITDCYAVCPIVDTNGCDNGIIRGNTVGIQAGDTRASIIFGANSKKIIVQGNRLAHANNVLTIAGIDHVLSDNEISSLVAFDSACTNVKYDSTNTDSGFSGTVPFAKNFIETKGQELAYTLTWTTTGNSPSFGDADVRARYLVDGRTCKVRVHIRFGSATNFGSGAWRFSIPIPSATTSYFTGSAFLGNQAGVAVVIPSNGYVTLYTSSGTTVDASKPFVWAPNNYLSFEYEYNLS